MNPIDMKWVSVSDDALKRVDQAAEFLQNEFCPDDSEPIWSGDYFRWKLGELNPAGGGYLSLAMINGSIVGTVSLTCKRMIINGAECLGGEVGDTFTSAKIRLRSTPKHLSLLDSDPKSFINRSIFGRLASEVRERAQADGIKIIYGTPNKNAYPGWVKRLGFFEFKEYYNRSFSRPTTNFLAKKYPKLRIFSPIFHRIENSLISLQKIGYLTQFKKRIIIDHAMPSASELDKFWKCRKPIKGFSLIRDAHYWHHRYIQHPLAEYTFFSFREHGALIGFVVTRQYNAAMGNRRYVSIAEWMLDESIPFGYVLNRVLNFYMKKDVDLINVWLGNTSKEASASTRSLFLPRPRVPIIFADNPEVNPILKMVDSFELPLGSCDSV